MTTALSGRHLGSRQLMPTALQKSERCGGSPGLELNQLSRGTSEPTFIANPALLERLCSNSNNHCTICNPMGTRSFIRAQMSPNTQKNYPSIMAFLLSASRYLRMNVVYHLPRSSPCSPSQGDPVHPAPGVRWKGEVVQSAPTM